MISSTEPSLVHRHWGRFIPIGLIVIGLLLVGFFGVRTLVSYIRIQRTGLQAGITDVEAIRGWMTIPYIGQAYGVPEEFIFAQIGIPQIDNQTKSLSQLNRTYAPGESAVILEQVKAAIRQYQATHLEPPGGKP